MEATTNKLKIKPRTKTKATSRPYVLSAKLVATSTWVVIPWIPNPVLNRVEKLVTTPDIAPDPIFNIMNPRIVFVVPEIISESDFFCKINPTSATTPSEQNNNQNSQETDTTGSGGQ